MAATGEVKPWKNVIFRRLKDRNRIQTQAFAPIIAAHKKLQENADSYKQKNTSLTLEVERLRQDNLQLQLKGGQGGASSEAVSALEKKIFKLQEELTEMHRKKGENAQLIIDLNHSVQEKEKQLLLSNKLLKEANDRANVQEEYSRYMETKLQEEKTTREVLADEQQALQLAFTSLEEKFRKMQDDNNDLVTRWMAQKAEMADRMNSENDLVVRAKQKKLQQQLEEAAKEHKEITPPREAEFAGPAMCFAVSIPNTALHSFDAHDGEVNAVRWGPTGRIFATGGSDRKLKLWEVISGRCENKGVLMGSNAAIMSVAFDQEESLVLAASNDFASRVWSIQDQRLRHTLTGHSGKVLAAKFFGDSNKVVSGSYDRTLKIWDLRSKACIKTIFAGSSCNDVVATDSQNVISGHFDRKIRFWDMRSDASSNEIYIQGRVTSLDLSPDLTTLLSCSRDDTLKLIDLRMNLVTKTLNADGFHVGADWSRAVFSPDGHYVMAGSSDGSLFVWNVFKNNVEKVLHQHRNSIIACHWCPTGTSLLSCDKQRSVTYWADF